MLVVVKHDWSGCPLHSLLPYVIHIYMYRFSRFLCLCIYLSINLSICFYLSVSRALSISLSIPVVLLSDPSLAFSGVIIWSKFVFFKNTVCLQKRYKDRGLPFQLFFVENNCAQTFQGHYLVQVCVFKTQPTWTRY